MSDITEELGKPVHFVRFNPDTKERNKQATLAAAIRHAFANPPGQRAQFLRNVSVLH
jgi:hypothetical protein